ncbi:MAG: ATP-binding cassette domain-containing protein, partial [Mesorhizobium sp.]
SGCGKTTLLRMIAGFDNPTSGSIAVDGQPMEGIPANRRPTNMVFQSYAIFPHLNVEQNVAYGLKRLKLQAGEERRRVEEALAQVSLTGLGKRGATELSGGQRQRVAIARALILEPSILLLDEPTSALDASVQAEVLNLLEEVRRRRKLTFLMVSHDLAIITHMCERLMVMQNGEAVETLTASQLIGHRVSEDYTRNLLRASEGFVRA